VSKAKSAFRAGEFLLTPGVGRESLPPRSKGAELPCPESVLAGARRRRC
jgi:hypothetical protein